MYKAIIFASFFLSLILALVFPGQIKAQFETPENLDIKLSGLAVVNKTLISTLEIDNPSGKTLSQVYYSATLTTNGPSSKQLIDGQESVSTMSGLLVNYSDSEPFTIEASSKTEKEIKLPFTEAIPSGTYYLSVQLKDQNTQLIRFTTTEAFLNGQNQYLFTDPNSCVLKVNNNSFPPNQGAVVKPNTSPTAECTVTNPGKVAITVRPKVDYAERFVVGFQKDVIGYAPKETITFNPGQSRTVSVVLPAIAKPQVYEGLFYLIDSNSSKISLMTNFRWTVEGQSARVEFVVLDKDYYSGGSTAKVEVKAHPSMDLYWRQNSVQGAGFSPQAGTDLNSAKLAVKITSNGSTCGSQVIDMPSTAKDITWPVQKLDIQIAQNCTNPKVEVEIKDGDKVLTKGEKVYQSPPTGLSAVIQQQNYLYLIMGAVIVIIGAVTGFVMYKRRKNPPSSPPPTNSISQTVTTAAVFLLVVGLSAFVVKQFNLIDKVVDDMEVLAQFSGPTVRVTGGYQSSLTDSEGQPIGGFIDAWGIVSEFTQNGGQSPLTIPIDCSQPPRLTIRGYSTSGMACENNPTGLHYTFLLDGQPINVASATSPDSPITSSGNTVRIGAGGWAQHGPRTANLTFSGGQLSYATHSFTARFYVLPGGESDIKSINAQFVCQQPCPAGQTNPHGICNGKSCTQVNSCGVTTCGTNVDCGGCLPGQQQPHLTCVNQSCQQVDACGTNACANNQDCCPAGQITPHLTCINQSCQPVNACGASTCAVNNDCCPPGQTSPHQECEGTNCRTVDSCGPPIVCTKPGETVPHGVCDGVSCRQVNTCGVTSCTEDKQCYSDDMCKCDGFNAINIQNPETSQFEFEAFAKVLTENAAKAKVQSIEFLMTKTSKSAANQNAGAPIGQSGKLTPTVVSSGDGSVRFRAAWKVNPPSYDPNATYRVFSKINCAPKATSSSASLDEMLALATDRVYSSDTPNVLGEELNYSPAKLVQNNYLELGTLKDGFYTRLLEADTCSAVRFEYGRY